MPSLKIPKEHRGPPLEYYEKKEEIGGGSYGTVCSYKRKKQLMPWGRNTHSHDSIAVKTVLVRESDPYTTREIELVMQLNNCNIVSILGAEIQNDTLRIKMELANTDLYKLKTSLSLKRLLPLAINNFAHQLLSGLCYLHEKSIVHRDLKPQNILAFWDDKSVKTPILSVTLKICDFGLSRFINASSVTVTAVGTTRYMAPEVAQAYLMSGKFNGDYKKADVFSMGAILYEMLYDEKPYSEEDIEKTQEVSFTEGTTSTEKKLIKFISEMLLYSAIERCEAIDATKHLNLYRSMATHSYMEDKNDCGMRPLNIASLDGDVEEVEWLIDSGEDVNKVDDNCTTPLEYVKENSFIPEMLSWKKDFDLNYDWTALQGASMNGHFAVVQLLFASGAIMSREYNNSWEPLKYACKNGHLSIAELLINEGAGVNGSCGKDKSSPLHIACEYGQLALAQLLIEKGAHVNITDDSGRALLHLACEKGRLEIAQFLIENGADVNKGDNKGLFPMCYAYGYISMIRLLVSSGADVDRVYRQNWRLLHSACQNGQLSFVQLLIEKGADINKADAMGNVPIFYACINNHTLIAQLLISKGADVNIGCNFDSAPLHYACDKGHLSIIRLTAELGANINQADRDGLTPLLLATKKNHLSAVQFLIENKADVNRADKDGKTPLFFALEMEYQSLFQLLLQKGAVINTVEADDWTKLQLACRDGRFIKAQMLIENGASVNCTDSSDCTPLHWACRNGHLSVAQLLIEKGANVNKLDNSLCTPLHYSYKFGHLPVVQLLVSNGADVNKTDQNGKIPLQHECLRIPQVEIVTARVKGLFKKSIQLKCVAPRFSE